jgi:hypothetical protein
MNIRKAWPLKKADSAPFVGDGMLRHRHLTKGQYFKLWITHSKDMLQAGTKSLSQSGFRLYIQKDYQILADNN